jgi:hypothetical protein
MPGITPNEGENAIARILYKAEARTANLVCGLWVGTWNNDETRTFAQSNDSVLTKITASGMTETTLTDATWNVTADNATYPDRVFTNNTGAPVTVNGHYIALTIGGQTIFLHIERDPNQREIVPGAAYTVGLSNVVA